MTVLKGLRARFGGAALGAACAGLLMIAAGAQAQNQTDPAPIEASPAPIAINPAPAPLSEVERVLVEQSTALGLARLALLYVRQVAEPRPDDYRIAALMLGEARRRLPEHIELLRLEIEAWHAAGDDERSLERTADLVRLDPADTVAQLRLISSRLREYQSAEEREEVFERLLSHDGRRLDDSVRSRLALDSALLARERGDNEKFVARLTQALQLDATNKEAALAAATWSLHRISDPLQRIEVLINVVLADPIDVNGYLALAKELLSQGAYTSADRFLGRCLDLYNAMQLQLDDEFTSDLYYSAWGVQGAKATLDQYRKEEQDAQYVIRKLKEAKEQAGEDPMTVPDYEPSVVLEKLRLITAIAVDSGEDIHASMERMILATNAAIMNLARRAEESPEFIESAIEFKRHFESDLLWLSLWSVAFTKQVDFGSDQVRTGLQKLRAGYEQIAPHMNESGRQVFTGWFALREGRLDEAEAAFAPLADEDPRARVGLIAIAEARDDRRGALLHLAKIAAAEPGAPPYPQLPYGMFARSRIGFILRERLSPSADVLAVERAIARLPAALDEITQSAEAFLHLSARQVKPIAGPFDSADIRIKIINTSPFALAVGPSAPINSSFILAPRVLVDGYPILQELKPEVVSLDRRLRLRPGEELTATVWAGQGDTGLIITHLADKPISVRWNVIQGFQIPTADQESAAQYRPGALCAAAESDLQTRSGFQRSGKDLEAFVAALRTARGERFLGLMIEARRRLIDVDLSLPSAPPPPPVRPSHPTPEEIAAITAHRALQHQHRAAVAQAVAERLAAVTPEERAFAMLILPPGWAVEEAQIIDDLAATDPSPAVRLAMLISRVSEADDPLFTATTTGDDPMLAEVASLVRARRAHEEEHLRQAEQAEQAKPAATETPDGFGDFRTPGGSSGNPGR